MMEDNPSVGSEATGDGKSSSDTAMDSSVSDTTSKHEAQATTSNDALDSKTRGQTDDITIRNTTSTDNSSVVMASGCVCKEKHVEGISSSTNCQATSESHTPSMDCGTRKNASRCADSDETTNNAVESLRFAGLYEEHKKNSGGFFTKNYSDEDWMDNHFLIKNNTSEDGIEGVILSSYQLAPNFPVAVPKATPDGSKETSPQPLLTMQFPSVRKPNLPDGPGVVREFLEDLKTRNPDDFQKCTKLTDIFDEISHEDLPQQDEIVAFARRCWKSSSNKKFLPMYKRLSGCAMACGQDAPELVLGFGHVRRLYTVQKKKGKEEETKIVNGPLMEMPVAVKRNQKDGSIQVLPRGEARVKWNGEVLAALVSAGGGGDKVVKDLYRMAAECDPSKLIPGRPCNYHHYLDEAGSLLSWSHELKKQDCEGVHDIPSYDEEVVITDAWCLFLRPSSNTIYSRDALASADTLAAGGMKMTRALSVLAGGSTTKRVAPQSSTAVDKYFPLPLIATATQRKSVEEFFRQGKDLLVIQGPPGCGKTHTAVNFAAVALSRQQTTLVTSNNPRALIAFEEKLTPPLRKICLNVASCVEGGMTELHKMLEGLQIDLSRVKEEAKTYNENIKSYREELQAKQDELSRMKDALSNQADARRQLLGGDSVKHFLMLALKSDSKKYWMVSAALEVKDIEKGWGQLHELKLDQDEFTKNSANFHFEGEVSDSLLDLATQKRDLADGTVEAPKPPRFVSTFNTGKKEDTKPELSGLTVNGIAPSCLADWDRAVVGLKLLRKKTKFHDNHVNPLLELGCLHEQVYAENGVSFRMEFVEAYKELMGIQHALADLSSEDRGKLRKCCASVSASRMSQARCRQLSAEIQKLDGDLVSAEVMVWLSEYISDADLGKLSHLTQLVARAKNNVSSKSSGRVIRHHGDFVEAMRACMGCLPFVIMTTEQVCELTAPTHRFGLSILDEASQSDCTALTIMARSEQMVVMGDDKQVSPTDDFWSEESISCLEASLPEIGARKQFRPGFSFYEVCRVAFSGPGNFQFLEEHFRCPPGVIAWSNEQCYHGRLVPQKVPSKESPLSHFRVEGKRDKNKKTNEVECDKIVELVVQLIQQAASNSSGPVKTIGIISMGGQNQCKLIEKRLDEALDSLKIQYGRRTVDRHRRMVGEPSQFQGGERDIIFLSCVYDTTSVYGETELPRQRLWNVAMSRAKQQVHLVHSYDISHIKNSFDVKRGIFSQFLHAQIPCEAKGSLNEAHSLRAKIAKNLTEHLARRGFGTMRKGGHIWGNSLCVRNRGDSSSASALVCIENYGESQQEWCRIAEQQLNLERSGIPCLRVDAVSLVVDAHSVLGDIDNFLAQAGVTDVDDSPTAVSESSSDSDSTASPKRPCIVLAPSLSNPLECSGAGSGAISAKKRRISDDDDSGREEEEGSL